MAVANVQIVLTKYDDGNEVVTTDNIYGFDTKRARRQARRIIAQAVKRLRAIKGQED